MQSKLERRIYMQLINESMTRWIQELNDDESNEAANKKLWEAMQQHKFFPLMSDLEKLALEIIAYAY